ncbi:MAG: ATP-binding protein [Bacteroidales bacterium]|nr:ATP-binding protein [Bacteroidales bacterium]
MGKQKTKELENPFVYKGYDGPTYFCDREKETENLISALKDGRNITLLSPRKIGKTGLIKHVFNRISSTEKDTVCIYVDIFSTQNLHDFVQVLGAAIVDEALRREKSLMSKVLDAFKAWRPVVTVDVLTGMPSLSLNIDSTSDEYTLKSIFDYLKSSKKKVYVAIDEFQQVAYYPEKGTEALLRSHVQFSNAGFIFSGSRQHLMAEMFNSPQRPFYQSTEFMNLQPIPEDAYYEFASRFFEAKKGSLSQEVFHDIYQRFDGYTWYIQLMMNRLYEGNKRITELHQATDAIIAVLATLTPQYEMLMTFLTSNQVNLLKAIAKEGKVEQPQSNEFIKRNDLPSPSSVKAALDVLVDKELVYTQPDGYIIYDRLLNLWLQRGMTA